MKPPDDRAQQDLVRERFTRTAQQFGKFSLTKRTEEAELLTRLVAPRGDELALDLACGPGTFTQAFAPRVKFMVGLDLTSALLEQARDSATRAGLANLAFSLGDAAAIPFPDGSLDLATCGYSLHHFSSPASAVAELARVVRAGGRVALADIIAPEDDARAAANNTIECTRDASHVKTLQAAALRALVEAAGLRVCEWKVTERVRSFDDWMRVAGWERGNAAYTETRRLMEASMALDTAGFHPRLVAADIEWIQTSAFLVAEKP